MFQPSSPEPRPEAVPVATDRETVIRFVISGPFLNAEARTEPVHESGAALDLQALLGRIGELELQLRDERSRVDALCKALTAGKPSATAAEAAPRESAPPEPPREPVAAPRFTMSAVATPAASTPASVAPVASLAPAPVAPAPSAPAPAAPALTPVSFAPTADRARTHTFDAAPEPVSPPKLHALSTAASPPPPKVRGLRRMIGALRHL
jgi:hypothetical protein